MSGPDRVGRFDDRLQAVLSSTYVQVIVAPGLVAIWTYVLLWRKVTAGWSIVWTAALLVVLVGILSLRPVREYLRQRAWRTIEIQHHADLDDVGPIGTAVFFVSMPPRGASDLFPSGSEWQDHIANKVWSALSAMPSGGPSAIALFASTASESAANAIKGHIESSRPIKVSVEVVDDIYDVASMAKSVRSRVPTSGPGVLADITGGTSGVTAALYTVAINQGWVVTMLDQSDRKRVRVLVKGARP